MGGGGKVGQWVTPRREAHFLSALTSADLRVLMACCGSVSVLGGVQVEGSTPVYLPVSFRLLNADLAFLLQEANQDLMRNSSLQERTQAFLVQRARQTPVVAVSYGPWSLRQALPPHLLQPGGAATPTALPLTFSWTVQAFIIREQIHPSWPRVQVLFYLAGRRWGHDGPAQLPCVVVSAFHETQEVRGACRLEAPLGLCLAQLQPLASWFRPSSIRPGRHRVREPGQGTPVELYYQLQPTGGGGAACSSPDSGPAEGGSAGPPPMQHIGSIRLLQPLTEVKLDQNFLVMVPSAAARQGETLAAFLAYGHAHGPSTQVQTFSLRWVCADLRSALAPGSAHPPPPASHDHKVIRLRICLFNQTAHSRSSVAMTTECYGLRPLAAVFRSFVC